MKEILLTKGYTAIVDDEDFEYLSQWKWAFSHGYARRSVKDRHVLMHREIMNPPAYLQVDHVNGNGLDNRRENLRIATNAQNQQNRQVVAAASGFKGVYFHQSKWRAAITVGRRFVSLGMFSDPIQAAIAYDRAAFKYFGEFAMTNFQLGVMA